MSWAEENAPGDLPMYVDLPGANMRAAGIAHVAEPTDPNDYPIDWTFGDQTRRIIPWHRWPLRSYRLEQSGGRRKPLMTFSGQAYTRHLPTAPDMGGKFWVIMKAKYGIQTYLAELTGFSFTSQGGLCRLTFTGPDSFSTYGQPEPLGSENALDN